MNVRTTLCMLLAVSSVTMAACSGCGSAPAAYGDPDGNDGGTTGDGGSTGGCLSDADCAAGQTCSGGVCTTTDGGSGGSGDGGSGGTGDGGTGGCVTNADCAPTQVCDHGTCVCDGDDDDGRDGTCKSGKTLVCHYPPGNPDNRHDICVGNAAVPAHEAHGDTLGACP